MAKMFLSLAGLVVGTVSVCARVATADEPPGAEEAFEADPQDDVAGAIEVSNPPPGAPPVEYAEIPPYVEGEPIAAPGGGYCYVGSHPVDTRQAAGPLWEESNGAHTHYYPPIDLRLFAFQNGCYYFIGDPADFGYQGSIYSYYGAHPIAAGYGGGWCFMIGGHRHAFVPWTSYFSVSGPWYYWQGPYDAYFHTYNSYYSFYYRRYYPRYYGGGRYWRNRDNRVPPPISRVPRIAAPAGPGGAPPSQPARGWRGAPPGSPAPSVALPGWRAAPPSNSVPAAPVTRGWPAPQSAAPGSSAPRFSIPPGAVVRSGAPVSSPGGSTGVRPQGGVFGGHSGGGGGGHVNIGSPPVSGAVRSGSGSAVRGFRR